MNPDDFLKTHPPKIRQSRLTPAWSAIQKMRSLGSSLADIKTFLEENGIKTSLPNLSLFIKRQTQADREKPKQENPGASSKQPDASKTGVGGQANEGVEKPGTEVEGDSSTTTHDSGDSGEPEIDHLAAAIKDKGEKLDKFAQTGIQNIFKKGTTK